MDRRLYDVAKFRKNQATNVGAACPYRCVCAEAYYCFPVTLKMGGTSQIEASTSTLQPKPLGELSKGLRIALLDVTRY
jgi:hypothetical protein